MKKPVRFSFSGGLFFAALLAVAFYSIGLVFYAIGDPIWVKTPADKAQYLRSEHLAVVNFFGSWLLLVGATALHFNHRKRQYTENETAKNGNVA